MEVVKNEETTTQKAPTDDHILVDIRNFLADRIHHPSVRLKALTILFGLLKAIVSPPLFILVFGYNIEN
jgi:hypothetical protein